uniref:Ig-like domain-containing protein n=1 Tax=Maylandia zebra TaxID=106582 RepID=A0A3P9AQZ0_9CICH
MTNQFGAFSRPNQTSPKDLSIIILTLTPTLVTVLMTIIQNSQLQPKLTLQNLAPLHVLAFAGGDVILPCSFNISDNTDFPTVEWSKEGLKPDVVFLYRDGCEAYEMKNPAFDYRTSLIVKELKDGNISLRISNVQVSDTGKYQCLIFQKNAIRKVTKVELVVGMSTNVHFHIGNSAVNCVVHQPEMEYVHLYRDRKEVPDMKMASYFRRTELFMDDMKHGNISLKILNVSEEDNGRYRCFIPKLQSRVKAAVVELVVGEKICFVFNSFPTFQCLINKLYLLPYIALVSCNLVFFCFSYILLPNKI